MCPLSNSGLFCSFEFFLVVLLVHSKCCKMYILKLLELLLLRHQGPTLGLLIFTFSFGCAGFLRIYQRISEFLWVLLDSSCDQLVFSFVLRTLNTVLQTYR